MIGPETKICGICLEINGDRTYPVTTYCGHDYCYPCISEWQKIRDICPICKKPCQYDISLKDRCIIELKSISSDLITGAMVGFCGMSFIDNTLEDVQMEIVRQIQLLPDNITITGQITGIFSACSTGFLTMAFIGITLKGRGVAVASIGALAGSIALGLEVNPYISAIFAGIAANTVIHKVTGTNLFKDLDRQFSWH